MRSFVISSKPLGSAMAAVCGGCLQHSAVVRGEKGWGWWSWGWVFFCYKLWELGAQASSRAMVAGQRESQ